MSETTTDGWRLMRESDMEAVARIAAEVHPDFFERTEVLDERRRLYPAGARLLERDGAPAGYLFSHPWRPDSLPALDSFLGAIPAGATSYYVHDLALLGSARGTGAARAAVADIALHAITEGFAAMSLVAVNGSLGFWRSCGFAARDVPHLARKLAGYEAAARFMVRPLT